MEFVLVLLGVGLLYGGGELLVRGAVNISRIYGLSPLVVGLTVVAFGTSAPELAASLTAAFKGSPEISLGNVIGSNSANIGLILGLAALIDPISAHAKFLVREMPVLIGVSLLLPLVLLVGDVERYEGIGLVLFIVPYIWILLRERETKAVEAEFEEEYGRDPGRPLDALALTVGGILLLVGGASALVEGAVEVARSFGFPEHIIGITLVAFGTSLPELATSIVAAMRREGDIALGNVVGSNVFNVLVVLGLTATVRPLSVAFDAFALDTMVMLGFTFALAPFVMTGRTISRVEGIVLLAGYLAYVVTVLTART
jgi:cation:H+ antiporter